MKETLKTLFHAVLVYLWVVIVLPIILWYSINYIRIQFAPNTIISKSLTCLYYLWPLSVVITTFIVYLWCKYYKVKIDILKEEQ